MEDVKRAKNFTSFDKHLLTDIASRYVQVIKTDATNVKMKKDAWEEVASKFNASNQSGKRTAKQLHALYDGMKKKARKNIADDKEGGGTYTPKTDIIDEKIVSMLKPQFQPLKNVHDFGTLFGYSINILLAMLYDDRPVIRTLAYKRILKARLTKKNDIRSFVVPDLNFEASDYTDLIAWETVEVTEPPLTFHIEDINSMIMKGVPPIQTFSGFPCHTQAVERTVKLVTEAAAAVFVLYKICLQDIFHCLKNATLSIVFQNDFLTSISKLNSDKEQIDPNNPIKLIYSVDPSK
ncbi:hypothetical protein RI129_003001 [Pyrocoelia pectoralis]|uniref:Regulatory protein zeste n=1 Tax=Pyrocoelia pectoralis TaxID=417401 RepID=A0AAN7VQT9_9COLE